MRRKICFLSMDDLGDYVTDDELTFEPLRELGWEVETISWRAKDVDWKSFEAVIIRTPWDYQNEPTKFLEVLEEIENSTRLENPYKIVKWNLSKTYLRDLEEKGVKIVPTHFSDKLIDKRSVAGWFDKFETEQIIIKPIVSATAGHTYRLTDYFSELTDIFRFRKYMVQPFMQNIISEGEYSLFYFGGEFSHAMLKTPKKDDFRVQEDFGGINKLIEPGRRLFEAGERALGEIGQNLLYARVDFVRDKSDEFALMELELIEPSLYFRMDKASPKRFAKAFDRWMKK